MTLITVCVRMAVAGEVARALVVGIVVVACAGGVVGAVVAVTGGVVGIAGTVLGITVVVGSAFSPPQAANAAETIAAAESVRNRRRESAAVVDSVVRVMRSLPLPCIGERHADAAYHTSVSGGERAVSTAIVACRQ
jgi:hypothetical protein